MRLLAARLGLTVALRRFAFDTVDAGDDGAVLDVVRVRARATSFDCVRLSSFTSSWPSAKRTRTRNIIAGGEAGKVLTLARPAVRLIGSTSKLRLEQSLKLSLPAGWPGRRRVVVDELDHL